VIRYDGTYGKRECGWALADLYMMPDGKREEKLEMNGLVPRGQADTREEKNAKHKKIAQKVEDMERIKGKERSVHRFFALWSSEIDA
jgi:hypothetical protein